MDIWVVKQFTDNQIKKARLWAAHFHKPKATSSVTNLLNCADAGTTVLLCEDHVRAFAHKPVLRKYGYRKADDPYPYVMGNCDYCQLHTKCTLFIHDTLYADVWKTKEQRRRDLEYATIVTG